MIEYGTIQSGQYLVKNDGREVIEIEIKFDKAISTDLIDVG